MSTTIPTKHIDGDVSIGRNVAAGGDANIQGSAHVSHDLKVDGWLEAKNVKAANKGLFATAGALREAYPQPHDGWFAGVSATNADITALGLTVQQGKALFRMYIGSGGEWVCEPLNKLYEITVDNAQVGGVQTSLTELQKNHNALATRVSTLETKHGTDVESIRDGITEITDSIGKANGIAPLDEYGKIPTRYIPAAMDDVKEFAGTVENVTFPSISISLGPTHEGCAVCYDTGRKRFVLQQAFLADDEETTLYAYYNNWLDGDSFGEATTGGRKPNKDKVYVDVTTNKSYRWSGSDLVAIGSDLALGHTANTAYPGDEGAALAQTVSEVKTDLTQAETRTENIGVLRFDGILSGDKVVSSGVWFVPKTETNEARFVSYGRTQFYGFAPTDYNLDGAANESRIYRRANKLYRIEDGDLVELAGASVGNEYNLTAEVPTPDPERIFYTMADPSDKYYAPAWVVSQKKAKLGMNITFAIAKESWKTYKYVGLSLEDSDVLDPVNWIDNASLSAGSEPMINVNGLCGEKDYTLSLAIQAILDMKESTGIDYRKEGLVITYRRDSSKKPHVWETKQFQGSVDDMTATTEELWKDFGNGGGGTVKTSDTAAKDGKDAFSTGGAYEMEQAAFAGLQIDPDPEDYIIQAVSKAGNAIGDPVKIPKSNGAGQATGSTLTIYCDQAVWGRFGSEISLMAAIKSVSYDGDSEVLGTIRTLAIEDPVTGQEIWSETVNQGSSTTASDKKFKFSFTDFITSASNKDFRIVAIDADGNRRTKTITVAAVDVTCTCVQTLTYSQSTTLSVNGSEKSIPMYKFANNVSTRQGIEVKTEMYYNGEWRTLGIAIVTDTYSHNITINPSDVFGGGEKLAHGSYALRIQGKDVASGVTGNTVYTDVMCVDPASTAPIVAIRYDDRNGGKVRLYDSIKIDVAAYTSGKTNTPVTVVMDGKTITTLNCPVGQPLSVEKQVQGYKADGTKILAIQAQSGTHKSQEITVTVIGSAIEASLKEGAVFAYDFSTRSNDETDHKIEDNGIAMTLEGCNYNSNGFRQILGEQVLRIAENVKAEIPYAPFASNTLETAGCAIQFAFSTKRIKDKHAKLMECYDPASGVGFFVRGNEVVLEVQNGTPKRAKVRFKCGEKHTVAVVVEPGPKNVDYKGTQYSMVKLYMDGEEAGSVGYQPGTSALRQTRTITFNSENGDFNLNYIMAYNSYMEWIQAYYNYLCKISDVDAMISEYNRENVLDATGKPSMALMAAKGMPYCVIVADPQTFVNFDYALNGGTSTSDQFVCTLYYINPQHPEVSFKAINVLWRRQGTTSAQRTEKNDRFNFNKKNKGTGLKATVVLLNPDSSTELGRRAILAAKHNKVYVSEEGMFVDVVTVKKDFNDSSMANDCSVCDMMNATFRALGPAYMTPAQRAYDGTQDLGGGDILTGLKMDHSTKNHPIACFRATSDTLQDAWFQARGNWKEDKGEQVALGFKDTPGYNLGCLNHGDFVEFFGLPTKDSDGHYTGQETLDQIEARFKTTEGLDESKPYLLSQYCGRDYRIMRYKEGAWQASAGSMKQVNGKWKVTGDVKNPVCGFELLQYAGMDWWQGVSSVDDMMAPTTQQSSWVRKLGLSATTYPAWTYYFECMVDDDQLQEDLALGKKVPYELFNLLRFFDSCDYSKTERAAVWRAVWKKNAYKYMSLESAMAYTAFTDYRAAVDQRAKNMQPMWFLEDGCEVVNGVYTGTGGMEPIRMYLNKVYDCDTCDGADNDGGNDIDPEVDPNKATNEETGYVNPYMGSGSVLFVNMDKEPELWNAEDGVTTITLKSVVNRMRNVTAEIDGRTLAPFSPEGALYFSMEKRINFWPKTVVTYDCESKYINRTNIANMPYFYALHGSGRTSLPRFIEQRWAIRDGYYQTGDFFTNPLSGRVSAITPDAKIYITAASTGYFGIGNDASGQLSETVFLEAGQSHAFTQFAHDAGALLYIYQPGRMSKIDLSEMTLAFHFDDLSKLELAEEVILGAEKHTTNTSLNGFNNLGSLVLGDMPFLKTLDVSGTTATSIDASGCPRVETIMANNTSVTGCKLAQTAPIESLTLPSTVTSLELVNLPKLTYPGGLTVAGMDNVSRLWVEGCSQIDTEDLLLQAALAGMVQEVRIPDINMTASVRALRLLRNSGATGLDASGTAYDEIGKCSGLSGRWILTEFIKTADSEEGAGLNTLKAYFPELNLYNSQFSQVTFSDDVADSENISNPENKNGYKYSTDDNYIPYVPSGHVLQIRDTAPNCRARMGADGKMHCKELHRDTLLKYADGTAFDPTDATGQGYDVMKYIPHYWYKGVNDFAKSEKHVYISSNAEKPMSTAENVIKSKVSTLTVIRDTALLKSSQTIDSDPVTSSYASTNVYKVAVSGMKLLRYPGVNAAQMAVVFVGIGGKVISTFSFFNSLSDMQSGDYIVAEVPNGAEYAWMTIPQGMDDEEVITSDSTNVESIEPDWLEHTPELIGVYRGYCDGQRQLRSISGVVCTQGDNTHLTNSDWQYDSEGNLTSAMVPMSAMHWTVQDMHNAAAVRGAGYQKQDYESWKDFSVMVMAILGTRNVQARCGMGIGGEGKAATGGYDTVNPQGFSNYPSAGGNPPKGNLLWGVQNYMSCGLESLSYCAMNIESWKLYQRNKCVDKPDDPVDYKWHSYNPQTKVERVIQGVNTGSGYCIGKVRWGKHCDIVCSQVTSDRSKWNQHYADCYEFQGSRGRAVCRAYYYAYADGGLVYAYALVASSNAYSYIGARLAFRGEIVFNDNDLVEVA